MTAKKSGSISLRFSGNWRRKRSIIMIEPPIAFFPSLGLLTPKLFTKVFANERMRVEMAAIVRIFRRKESSLFLIWQESLANSLGLKLVNDSVRPGIAGGFSKASNAALIRRSIKET